MKPDSILILNYLKRQLININFDMPFNKETKL